MVQAFQLLMLSAPTEATLSELAERYRRFFALSGAEDPGLGKQAFHPFDERLAIIASSREEFADCLADFARGKTRRGMVRGQSSPGSDQVVFVCPGQGSQWAGMGKSLLGEEPVFRLAIEECEERIRRHAGWSLIDLLSAGEPDTRLSRAQYAQPAIFAVEVALARLWQSWGVKPAAVIGHSSGEVAAAHLAGALTLEDALRVVIHSGQLLAGAHGAGGMAMVHAGPAAVAGDLAACSGTASIAAVNSPQSVVISGEPGAVAALAASWRKRGVGCVSMSMEHAFHTAAMGPIAAGLTHGLASLAARRHTIPIFSTVFGRQLNGELFDAEYWGNNLQLPVLFDAAVQSALEMGFTTFLEVSPHPSLLASIKERSEQSRRPVNLIPSLRRRQNETFAMLSSLGHAFVIGCPVDRREPLIASATTKPAGPALAAPFPGTSLLAFLSDQVRQILGMEAGSPIDEDQSLFELGFDSLLAVQFRDSLAAALGDPLDATILFNFPSIRSLAGHLQKQNAPAPVLPDDEFLENLKKMSDEEALQLLEAELKLS